MVAQGQDEQECVIGTVRDAVRDDLLSPGRCPCSPDSQRWSVMQLEQCTGAVASRRETACVPSQGLYLCCSAALKSSPPLERSPWQHMYL